MIERSQLAEIGAFNKPHGIKGEISAVFDPVLLDHVASFGHVFVELDGLMVPFTVLSARPKGSETLLLTLKGVGDEKMAARLASRPIYIEKALLPDDGEDDEGFYLDDLIGFNLDDDGTPVGKIVGYDDSTANVLFLVERPGGDVCMIPASSDLIEDVDVESGTISMSLPEGLVNL